MSIGTVRHLCFVLYYTDKLIQLIAIYNVVNCITKNEGELRINVFHISSCDLRGRNNGVATIVTLLPPRLNHPRSQGRPSN